MGSLTLVRFTNRDDLPRPIFAREWAVIGICIAQIKVCLITSLTVDVDESTIRSHSCLDILNIRSNCFPVSMIDIGTT